MFWIYSGVVFSVLASYFVYYSYKLWMQMNVGPELMEGGVVYYLSLIHIYSHLTIVAMLASLNRQLRIPYPNIIRYK